MQPLYLLNILDWYSVGDPLAHKSSNTVLLQARALLAVSWLWSEARGLAYGIPLIFEVFSENIYRDLRTITTARISLSQSLHHTTPQVFKSNCETSLNTHVRSAIYHRFKNSLIRKFRLKMSIIVIIRGEKSRNLSKLSVLLFSTTYSMIIKKKSRNLSF